MSSSPLKQLFLALVPCVLLMTPSLRQAGVVTWNGGGDGSSWHDAANWDPDGVPTADDDVTIDVDSEITVVHSIGEHSVNSLMSAESIRIWNSE